MNKALFITSEGQKNTADFYVRLDRPIDLLNLKWNISLIKLMTYYSWWNVSSELQNTVFKYNNGVTDKTLNLEPGNYSFSSLVDHIHDKMIDEGDYTLSGSTPVFSINFEMDLSDGLVTLILSDSYTVDFTNLNIRNLFGFNSQVYSVSSVAENKANIRMDVDTILVHLDIISGNSYNNGRDSDVLFSFIANGQPNEAIIIEPNNSLPIGINDFGQINRLHVYLTDQRGRAINLHGAPFSAVLHLSPVL